MASKGIQPPPLQFDEDAPELTDDQIKELRPASAWFAERGMPLPKGSQNTAATVTESVTIDVEKDVIAYYRSTGPGWQGRMADLLVREARKKSA